ncbi:MAG TPA: endonuclease III [Nitrososphaerales archaeon]|nr:endonuclease III [Nitrososphaerales archaeon]
MTAVEVFEKLDPIYPRVRTPLTHSNQFQLLIATILSAQSTDSQINTVTPKLFERFSDAESMALASIRELERLVHSTGFFHVKARRIRDVSRKLVSEFNGRVPDSMDALTSLPGVGRKTANVVLSAGFQKIEGIAVDTHVFRVSRRIGLASSNTPEKVEQELMKTTPKEFWPRLTILLILHGRAICHAKRPLCEKCVISSGCQYYHNVFLKKVSKESVTS